MASQAKVVPGSGKGSEIMNIWMAFFLVVSIVILAAPVLLFKETRNKNGSGRRGMSDNGPALEDDELQLDLASGRLTREDYEIMSRRKSETLSGLYNSAGGDHGNLPEG